jgi:hypothetical protein
MAVKMSMLVFWVVMPCGLTGRYQHFRGTCYLHLQGCCTLSCIGYIALNGRMSMNDELEGMWKAAVMICFKVSSQHLLEGTKDNLGEP